MPERRLTGTIAAYVAAALAFGYALVSLYWAAGGHGLISTVGGYAQELDSRGGAAAELLAWADPAAKIAGGLLALALACSWGARLPRRWLLGVSACASALLVVYGGLNVAGGLLVLSGAVHPAGADLNALRWHAGVWDLWFLLWGIAWGIALALATLSRGRGSAGPAAPGSGAPGSGAVSAG